MKRYPESWALGEEKRPKWTYTQGLELKAMMAWREILGQEETLLSYADAYADQLVRGGAPSGVASDDSAAISILTYKQSDYKLDDLNAGKLLFLLYDATGKQKYRSALDTLRRQLTSHPRVSEGGFWHKRIYPHQMWLDGLYMEAPFYAEYAVRYEEGAQRQSSLDDVVRQFEVCFKHTWCDTCHLLHHAWDESRSMNWANAETGRSAHAWGRAEGWYLMALVDVIEILQGAAYQGNEGMNKLKGQLAQLCATLLSLQRPSGCWLQVLDCPDREGNYEEMSATAMIAYAFMKGYRLGILGRPYLLAGKRAIEGMHIEMDTNGDVTLHDVCRVAGLSKDRDGSYEYYIGERIVDNDPKGVGPLLMALLEYPTAEYTVLPGNAHDLLHAIRQANVQSREVVAGQASAIVRIPNGLYDLGKQVLTRLDGRYVRLVGESMEGTVIRNKPDIENEGISTTATLLNTGLGNVLQNLTLENALDYYNSGFAGRAVALQDKGDSTVCQNVRLLSHQDTYFSNNAQSTHWFRDCEIHGTVDFICGDGDVYFDRCLLVAKYRKADGSGNCTLTAPKTRKGGRGFVFRNCTIRTDGSRFNLGRAWDNSPRCVYINTTLEQPDKLQPERFSKKGMKVCKAEFLEYNTMDKEGRTISPSSHILTITQGEESDTRERILKEVSADDLK